MFYIFSMLYYVLYCYTNKCGMVFVLKAECMLSNFTSVLVYVLYVIRGRHILSSYLQDQ